MTPPPTTDQPPAEAALLFLDPAPGDRRQAIRIIATMLADRMTADQTSRRDHEKETPLPQR